MTGAEWRASVHRTAHRGVLFWVVATAWAPASLAADRTLTLREGILSGGNFEIAWVGARRCPASIRPSTGGPWNDPAAEALPAIRLELDCRRRPNGAVADFTLFGGVGLGRGWTVSGSGVSNEGSGGVETRVAPAAGAATPLIRIRLEARSKKLSAASVTLTVGWAAPSEPLPVCALLSTSQLSSLVCSADADCGGNYRCSVACGNRCVYP